MIHSKKTKTIMRILVIFTIVLIALIIAYESTLLVTGNKTYQYVTAQEWVSQRIAKDALLMQYGTTDDRTQAINELQNELPYFEANNKQIVNSSEPDAIETLIHASEIDYTDIDTAARKIVAAPDKSADPVQVRIILDHERDYFLAYTQIASLVLQNSTAYVLLIFTIIISAKVVLIGTNGVLLYLLERKASAQ